MGTFRSLVSASPDPASVALVRRAALAVVAAGLVGLAAVGSGSAPRPQLVPAGTVLPAPGFPGFAEVSITVTSAATLPALSRARCAVLASTPATRSRGLMGRRDLGGYAGMLFTWPGPTTSEFYMAHTLEPLTLAWFDGSGHFLGSVDMQPCPSGQHCTYYDPPGPFVEALEVGRGSLAGLGIGEGATIATNGPCIT